MTYRDDLGALRTRLTNLEQEHAELRAQKRALDSATARIDEIDTELTDLRGRIDKERRLPLLDRVKIAAPCPANWDDMVGDDRVRFCGECTKNVYNVIELTREEAENVIREHEGDVCMRLYQRKDGTILTADCPVGQKRRRRRRLVAGMAVAGATLAGATWITTETVLLRAGAIEVGEAYHPQLGTPTVEEEEIYPVAGGTGMPVTQPAPQPTCETAGPPPEGCAPLKADATTR
jgi:hypothetical protein